MAEDLVLYSNPMSRGRMARWMLEEVGAPYSVEYVAYGPAMKSAEFLARNPMGKVPVLRHGDAIVTETAAICAYLADVFPEAGLAPDPKHRADYYRWMFFAAGPFEASRMDKAMGVVPPEDKIGMLGYGTFELANSVMNKAVAANDYILGDRFSAADVYVGSQIIFGLRFGSLDPTPAFERYAATLTGRDAFKRASAADDAAAAAAA